MIDYRYLENVRHARPTVASGTTVSSRQPPGQARTDELGKERHRRRGRRRGCALDAFLGCLFVVLDV